MAGIYIHIPFCKQACHYCNFYFSVSTALKTDLVKAIVKEIELSKDYLEGETIDTIYFGGGTPSLLNAEEIKLILETIYRHHAAQKIQELTFEANPDDLTIEKLTDLKSLNAFGLNRLSIGVQSFHNADLIYMNRAHNATEATDAIHRAQDAGFENMTIDLIYGTPTINDEQWIANLQTAFSLGIPHISSYALTVEEKTSLHKHILTGKAQAVSEEQSARQFDILIQHMRESGYEQYEISNFAKPGRYAIHNTNYWRGKKYLGLGPSAHSYNGQSRKWNVANNNTYIKSIGQSIIPHEVERLTPAQHTNEYIMTSLRTMWGCDMNKLQAASHKQQVEQALKATGPAFYILTNGVITLTQAGKHYADRIASDLFVEE